MVKSLIQKQLPPVASFTMLALVLFAYFFAGSAPSPTFVVLQHQWQFSASLLTVAFGVYSISLLVALIFFGALSDYIGRRPVIFVALIIQAGSMAMFVFANNIQGLIEARIVQGFATGIASGALAAAVVEAAPTHLKQLGALISSVSPLAGLAVGAIISGIALKYIAHPIFLVFGALTLVFILGAVLLIFTPESVSKREGAIASLVPKFSMPATATKEFFRAMPVLITTWALGGLYLALAPSIILHVFNIDNGLLNGLSIAVLSGIGAIAPNFLTKFGHAKAAIWGLYTILGGLLLLLISLSTHSLALFFIATALSGIGFGGAFSAMIQNLAPRVQKHERAGLFTAIFTVCYLALSIPAMLTGLLVKPFGLRLAVECHIGLLILTATLGLVLQMKSLKDLNQFNK